MWTYTILHLYSQLTCIRDIGCSATDGPKFVPGSAVIRQTLWSGIRTLCDVHNDQSAIGIHCCSRVIKGHSTAVPGDGRGRRPWSITVEGQWGSTPVCICSIDHHVFRLLNEPWRSSSNLVGEGVQLYCLLLCRLNAGKLPPIYIYIYAESYFSMWHKTTTVQHASCRIMMMKIRPLSDIILQSWRRKSVEGPRWLWWQRAHSQYNNFNKQSNTLQTRTPRVSFLPTSYLQHTLWWSGVTDT